MIGERRRGCVRAGAGRSREHHVDADELLVSFPVLLGQLLVQTSKQVVDLAVVLAAVRTGEEEGEGGGLQTLVFLLRIEH